MFWDELIKVNLHGYRYYTTLLYNDIKFTETPCGWLPGQKNWPCRKESIEIGFLTIFYSPDYSIESKKNLNQNKMLLASQHITNNDNTTAFSILRVVLLQRPPQTDPCRKESIMSEGMQRLTFELTIQFHFYFYTIMLL